jgi:hypothetical protein
MLRSTAIEPVCRLEGDAGIEIFQTPNYTGVRVTPLNGI